MNPIAVPVTSVVSAKHVVDETRDEMSECSTHLHGQSLHWGEKKKKNNDTTWSMDGAAPCTPRAQTRLRK